MKSLNIKNILIGQGKPKICIPLTGSTEKKIMSQLGEAKKQNCDIAEWRADYFYAEGERSAADTAKLYEKIMFYADMPVIFTLRTGNEGGMAAVGWEQHADIISDVIKKVNGDIIDLQLLKDDGSSDERRITDIVKLAHEHGWKVILSNHDFTRTPARADIAEMMCRMQRLGADLPKVAYMPVSEEDVQCLEEAAGIMEKTHCYTPFIAISMGTLGQRTRMRAGEIGSALTFAAGTEQSAPGQPAAADLRK